MDVLHALFLGVLNIWARIALWKLIESGAYGDLGTTAENIQAAVLVLRSSLMRWYVRYDRAHDEDLTRVSDLTPKMLGSSSDQKLKTKGAETWGVALFVIDELRVRAHMLGADGDRLRMAGEMLEQIVRSWKAHDWTIPQAQIQENDRAFALLFLMHPSPPLTTATPHLCQGAGAQKAGS